MRKIPDGAEWVGSHNYTPIYFKYSDGRCWYNKGTSGWSPYGGDKPSTENLFGFRARKLTLEEIMEDFITNE